MKSKALLVLPVSANAIGFPRELCGDGLCGVGVCGVDGTGMLPPSGLGVVVSPELDPPDPSDWGRRWRRRPVPLPDVPLLGVSLSGIVLPGVPLLGVSLPGVALPGVPLLGVSLPGVALPGVPLLGVSLPGVALPGVSLPGADWLGTSLEGCCCCGRCRCRRPPDGADGCDVSATQHSSRSGQRNEPPLLLISVSLENE